MPNDSVDKGSWESSACYPRRTFDSLSESPSTRNSRITMADFRLCSTSRSHSQAGLYHCVQKSDLCLTRAYLRAPPLLFRRHPPQINYPPCKVPPKKAVRHPMMKGWYFKVFHRNPTYPTQSIKAINAKL